MEKKLKHGKFFLGKKEDKSFYLYDTRLDVGRAFIRGKVKEFSYKTNPKVVKIILKKGKKLINISHKFGGEDSVRRSKKR